jgi:hypothetical protein
MNANKISIVVMMLVVSIVSSASAAPPKITKLQGDAYYFSIGQMYDLHAFQHAKMLAKFSADGATIPPEVLTEHVAAIRTNVAAADKAFSKISPATKKSPTTAKKLAELEQANHTILELCIKLVAAAKGNEIRSEAIAAHAADLKQQLTAAYQSAQEAAEDENLFTEQWDQPGNGAFSD